MNLPDLVAHATDKTRFRHIEDYSDFCKRYLEFIAVGIQAVILAQNEQQYRFLQYRDDGHRNITRPLNAALMLDADNFSTFEREFSVVLAMLNARIQPDDTRRDVVIRTIYTLQQTIGATLDALPAGSSNQARKINGDLFERLIRLLIGALGIACTSGIVKVPVRDAIGTELFRSSYQHDLLIDDHGELKIIGSVKTSSKDRIDKIFLDKFLYNRLTDTDVPHVAIFLNDVQRAQKRNSRTGQPGYGVSTTFLPGHFKAFTMKLNALDGVYYCDIRPGMKADTMLNAHIRTIDHFFTDLWELLGRHGQNLGDVTVVEGEFSEEAKDRSDTGPT